MCTVSLKQDLCKDKGAVANDGAVRECVKKSRFSLVS